MIQPKANISAQKLFGVYAYGVPSSQSKQESVNRCGIGRIAFKQRLKNGKDSFGVCVNVVSSYNSVWRLADADAWLLSQPRTRGAVLSNPIMRENGETLL